MHKVNLIVRNKRLFVDTDQSLNGVHNVEENREEQDDDDAPSLTN